FLGDAVLQLAVTEHLYSAHPTLPEGDLARRRAATVSTRALAVIASKLDLGAYVRLGRGEDLTGGRAKSSILADTTEAVIGAVHLALGQDVSRRFVLDLLRPLLDSDEFRRARSRPDRGARRPRRARRAADPAGLSACPNCPRSRSSGAVSSRAPSAAP